MSLRAAIRSGEPVSRTAMANLAPSGVLVLSALNILASSALETLSNEQPALTTMARSLLLSCALVQALESASSGTQMNNFFQIFNG